MQIHVTAQRRADYDENIDGKKFRVYEGSVKVDGSVEDLAQMLCVSMAGNEKLANVILQAFERWLYYSEIGPDYLQELRDRILSQKNSEQCKQQKQGFFSWRKVLRYWTRLTRSMHN
jgi:hypothetical protein